MKQWRKSPRTEFWSHQDWRIWSIQEDLGQRKYEIHCWVLYDGSQVVAVKGSKRAVFRVARRVIRAHNLGDGK